MIKYRPEIDGLRAVAVLPVLLFYAGLDVFSGGFVGVDIFFVISGYLITSIILNENAAGKFILKDFYERRAKRILPALAIVVLCTAIASIFILFPGELRTFARSVVALFLFGSNIHFWQESGYFSPATELMPLLHTWSLAVEEQFYLLFPIAFIILWRFGYAVFLRAYNSWYTR